MTTLLYCLEEQWCLVQYNDRQKYFNISLFVLCSTYIDFKCVHLNFINRKDIMNKKNSLEYIHSNTLFRNTRFMLDEMFQRNASKFAIFYIYENPKLFFISCYIIYSLNECPGLCWHRPGHSLGGKIQLHEMKKATWVFLYIKYGKFWSISLEH